MAIYFFSEDIHFSIKRKLEIKNWIKSTIEQEGKSLGAINIVFTSDTYLLKINQEFLNHNFFTDIITFQNQSIKNKVSGDLYISIERVTDNSLNLSIPFKEELLRVIIHGILHLCGYSDKSKEQESLMRSLENKYLSNINVPRGT